MKHVSIVLLIVMVIMASCTKQQKEPIKENGTSLFQPKPLDDEWSKWLVGKWQVAGGESEFLGDELEDLSESNEEGAGGFTIEFGLNGQFLIWTSWIETGETTDEQKKQIMEALKETTNASDEDLERFLSMPFKELQIQTINPQNSEVIGYLFDSQRCIAEGRGNRQGNKEILEWKWSGTGQGASSVSIIEKINDDKFNYTHKYILPNGNEMGEKIEMVRMKVETKE
jgi:hypothetical protein